MTLTRSSETTCPAFPCTLMRRHPGPVCRSQLPQQDNPHRQWDPDYEEFGYLTRISSKLHRDNRWQKHYRIHNTPWTSEGKWFQGQSLSMACLNSSRKWIVKWTKLKKKKTDLLCIIMHGQRFVIICANWCLIAVILTTTTALICIYVPIVNQIAIVYVILYNFDWFLLESRRRMLWCKGLCE